MLLAIDPSSTRTGYAIFVREVVTEAGYLRGRSGRQAIERVTDIAMELRTLIQSQRPEEVVIELPSGKAAARTAGFKGAGLTIYGMAAGAIFGMAAWGTGTPCPRVHVCTERDWTGGVPKARRTRRIAMEFPQYRAAMSSDGGGDVADAIGIGLWWMAQQTVKGSRVEGFKGSRVGAYSLQPMAYSLMTGCE